MSNDTQFIDGLLFKPPHERAPDYVKAKGSIKREELISWLSSQDGEWINFDLKVGQSGKWYAAVDNWKPESRGNGTPRQTAPRPQRAAPATGAPTDDFQDDDIPFITNRGNW